MENHREAPGCQTVFPAFQESAFSLGRLDMCVLNANERSTVINTMKHSHSGRAGLALHYTVCRGGLRPPQGDPNRLGHLQCAGRVLSRSVCGAPQVLWVAVIQEELLAGCRVQGTDADLDLLLF